MNCLICGDNRPSRLFEVRGAWFSKCVVCGCRFAELRTPENHVELVYGDDYFQGGGVGYPDYLGERQILIEHGRRYGKLLRKYTRRGTVLDIGAAAGFILRGLLDCGWTGEGIEPNPRMAEFARANESLEVHTSSVEEFHSNKEYDLITMIQVIVHLRWPDQALCKTAGLLRPGGLLLIETWDPDCLVARMLGKHWHVYVPPSVLYCFSPTTLERLAAKYGFRRIGQGRPAKWLNGAHVKSLLRFLLNDKPIVRTLGKLGQVIPDELKIPYPALDVYWMLLKKLG